MTAERRADGEHPHSEHPHGDHSHGGGRRLLRQLSWLPGLLLLAVLIGVVQRRGQEQQFAQLLRRAEPAWILVAALLQAATYLCAAGVWQRVIRRGGGRVRLRSLMPLAVARLFIDQALPTAGLGGRVLVVRSLRRRGVADPVAVAAVLVDLMTLYAAFSIGIVGSLLTLWTLHDLNGVVLAVATGFSVFALGVPTVVLWSNRGGDWHPPRWLSRIPALAPTLRAVARAPRSLVRDPRLWAEATVLQLLIFVLDAGTLGAMLRAVGSPAPVDVAFTGFVIASAAALITFVPGGLGTFETSSVTVLALLGVQSKAALAATLLLRGFTFWLPMLPGFWLSRREIRKAHRSALSGPGAPTS